MTMVTTTTGWRSCMLQVDHVADLGGTAVTMRDTRRDRPITFWTCVALAVLFVAAETFWVIREILDPCPACTDAGAMFPYTAIAFVAVAVPLLIVTLLLDARRNRLRARRLTPPSDVT
jgi:hypothetical protein